MGKRIGYAKLGRSMPLVASEGDFSDDEPARVLRDLAHRHPEDEFVILGFNSCDDNATARMPDNVVNPWHDGWRDSLKELRTGWKAPLGPENQMKIQDWGDANILPWFRSCDAVIIWLGQHGNTNSFIPPANGLWSDGAVKLHDEYLSYGSYCVRGVNAFRQADPLTREEIYLVADGRNHLKARDTKWPLKHPIQGQYIWSRKTKFERYGDTRSPEECGFPEAEWDNDHIWMADVKYEYTRLEISGILPWEVDIRYSEEFDSRRHFGLFINEARAYVGVSRLKAMQEYVLQLNPVFIHGKWGKESLAVLGFDIQQAPATIYYDILRSVKCTFSTPSSGTGWATTKPWQGFGCGTVTFFHPKYDTQDNILGDAPKELRDWLRVTSPEQLKKRVEHLDTHYDDWLWIIREQKKHYDTAVAEMRHIKKIEERIYGNDNG